MIAPDHGAEGRSLHGRIGAHESWARTADRAARTAPARAAMLAKFEKEVDPDGELPVQERLQRAEHLRRAYFLRLAQRSAEARARRSRRSQQDRVLVTQLREAADLLSPAFPLDLSADPTAITEGTAVQLDSGLNDAA